MRERERARASKRAKERRDTAGQAADVVAPSLSRCTLSLTRTHTRRSGTRHLKKQMRMVQARIRKSQQIDR